jgi:hypothetical protein
MFRRGILIGSHSHPLWSPSPILQQWFSILRSQVDTFGVVDSAHTEGTLPAGGEFVGTLPSEHPPYYQIIHLELSATHELLLVVLERLAVLCIFNRRLPSSLIDKVDIFAPELVLRDFIICSDMEGTHGDFRGEDNLGLIHQKERCFSSGPTG